MAGAWGFVIVSGLEMVVLRSVVCQTHSTQMKLKNGKMWERRKGEASSVHSYGNVDSGDRNRVH